MKKILVILALFLTVFSINGQEWTWSNQLVCDNLVMPMSIVTDSDNNVYIAGYFSGTSLSLGNLSITNAGDWDGFICKIDNNGTPLWLEQIASSDRDEIVSIVLKGTSLYVAGNFKADLSFSGTAASFSHENNYDSFLAEYDLNGNYQDATNIFSGYGVERIKNIKYNSYTGKLVISAQFKDEISYQTPTNADTTVIAQGNKDLIIAISDLSGIIQNKVVHTTSVVNSIYNDISLCQDEGYNLSGDLYGSIYFTSLDSITGNSTSSPDMVVVHLNENLDFEWARKGGGTGYDHALSSVSDEYGNIYVTGMISGSVKFDKNATEKSETIIALAEDLFIARYDKNGNLSWIKRNGSNGKDVGFGLVQQENLVQFCGNISDTVVFNTDTLTSTGISDLNAGFAIYDIDGNEIGAQGIGGSLATGEDKGQAIAFDSDRNTIIAGYFESTTMDIGDSSYTNSTGTNGFVASYYYPLKTTFTESQNVTCHGGNNGSLLATTYFGVGPYTYDWSASTGTGTFNDSIATNLTAGFYSLTVTDSRSESATTTITIEEPDTIIITIDSTISTCNGANDGTLIASASGGTAPYSYNWSGQNAVPNDSSQTNLETGKYYITVTDDNSCIATDSTTITEPDVISFSGTSVTGDDAGTNSGSIDLNVNGGTEPYSYSWENESGIMSGRIYDTLNNIPDGKYTAYVVDDNGCSNDTSLIVPGQEFIVHLIETNEISCAGSNDAVVTAQIVSGDIVKDYTFIFTDSLGNTITAIDDTIITELATGWYYVTASENSGDLRSSTDSIFISQPDSIILTLTTDNIDCYGTSTGSITLSRTGGTYPISYSWSNDKTTQSISSLSAGWYKVTATDNNGCSVIDSAEVIQNDSISITIIPQAISCYGEGDGKLFASTTGGVSPYSYSWDDPGNQTQATAKVLDAGTYTVKVTDNIGCTNNASGVVTEPSTIEISGLTTSPISCIGSEDGIAELSITGGTTPYSYKWADNTLVDTNKRSDLDPGDYSVTITDANGCELGSTITFTIDQPSSALTLSENTDAHTDNICFGESIGSITVNAAGGWGEYSYATDTNNWSSTNNFTNFSAGNYEIYVKDSNNCIESIEVEITEPTELLVSSSVVSNTIVISASGGTSPYSYQLNTKNSSQDSYQFEGLEDGTYWVLVTDSNNCGPVSSDTIEINLTSLTDYLLAETKIYPNPSDGKFNLDLKPSADGEFVIEVFSTNGSLVKKEVRLAQSGVSSTISFDLSNSPTGVYMLKINGIVLPSKLIVK